MLRFSQGELCRSRKVFFHTDAAQVCTLSNTTPAARYSDDVIALQAIGKIPVKVDEMKVDLMSISGHKIYGPKGVGVLYVRRRPRVRIEPIISGGGQERGMRSGTLPHPLVVGIGAACDIASREMTYDLEHVRRLSQRLIDGITSQLDYVVRNGDSDMTYEGMQ